MTSLIDSEFSEARSILFRHWDVKTPKIKKLSTSGFNSLWRVNSADGHFVLKAARNDPNGDWIKFANRSFLELEARNLIRTFIKGRTGEYVFGDRESSWTLSVFLEGMPLCPPAFDHIPLAADFLKRMHRIPVNLKCGSDETQTKLRTNWVSDLKIIIEDAEKIVQKFFLDVGGKDEQRFSKLLNDVNAGFQLLSTLPVTLSHGEFQTQNVIVSASKIGATTWDVIDWDSLSERPRIYDICSGLLFFCRRSRGSFSLDRNALRLFLSAVELTDSEQKVLPIAAAISLLPRKAHIEKFRCHSTPGLTWYQPWAINGAIEAYEQICSL